MRFFALNCFAPLRAASRRFAPPSRRVALRFVASRSVSPRFVA
jgi:hypothetical protein